MLAVERRIGYRVQPEVARMRLAEWPRMPFLREELCGWIEEHLATLGVDEIAIFAVEDGLAGDGRRVLVATEIGLFDYRYGPQESTARFSMAGRLYPWQAVRGVDLRVETSRLWALEHRTSWSLTMARPAFNAMTDDPDLGHALGDFAKAAVIMAEPAGAAGSEAPAGDPKPAEEPRALGMTDDQPTSRAQLAMGPGARESASRRQS